MAPITVSSAVGTRPAVLIVDDTDTVREVLQAGLLRHGLEVRVTGNGREAIEMYHETYAQDGGSAETVLLDVQMPGLDGPLVLAALQAIDPDVLAFFMTGDPAPYEEDGLLAMGARRVFRKPLDITAVAAELRRSDDRRPLRGPVHVGPK